MKRALILLIAMLMAFQGIAAGAEPVAEPVGSAAVELQPEDEFEEADPGAAESAFGGEFTVDGAEEEPEAEEPAPEIVYNYDELTIGSVTPFEGGFSTGMWGNVTSDLDIRLLLHGYNLVEWKREDDVFGVDPSVVSGIIVGESSTGDRTYVLTLYDDLSYCDGTPITARDYAFSLLLSISPQIAEIGGSVKPTSYLLGYEDYISGSTTGLRGVRVIGDDTLAITVSHEYLPFFYELALLDCTPLPIDVIAPGCRVVDDGEGAYIANVDETVTEPLFTADLLRETMLDPEIGYLSHPAVTCGPYKLVSYDGQTVELELNDFYKGNSAGEKPTIPVLHVRTVDNDTMIDELSRGELGLINKCVSADVLQQGTRLVAGSDVFAMSNYTRNGMAFISFSCEREPVSSVAVRQAIAHCLDKDGLVSDTVGNYGIRVDGYYGMGQWMYSMVEGSDYPVEAPGPEATQAEQDAYDEKVAEWEALTLENAPVYDFDVEAAAALLAGEGWTLNREGEPYDPEKDDVRCKQGEDGTIRPLELRMLCPEGSSVNDAYQANFIDHLAEAGILLTVEVQPMVDLLEVYYRKAERDFDMIALATNFDVVFDPSNAFRPDVLTGDGAAPEVRIAQSPEEVNPYNPTAIADLELYELAVAMRQTQPDDPLDYCRKWVAFQERFQALEPVIPIYSNVYFDFYPRVLHGYDIASNVSWSQALIGAYLSDVSDEELEGDESDDGFEIIGDFGA